MLNKKTIAIAVAGIAASVLLFKGIRRLATEGNSGEADADDLADSDITGDECDRNAYRQADCCEAAYGGARDMKALRPSDCCEAAYDSCDRVETAG